MATSDSPPGVKSFEAKLAEQLATGRAMEAFLQEMKDRPNPSTDELMKYMDDAIESVGAGDTWLGNDEEEKALETQRQSRLEALELTRLPNGKIKKARAKREPKDRRKRQDVEFDQQEEDPDFRPGDSLLIDETIVDEEDVDEEEQDVDKDYLNLSKEEEEELAMEVCPPWKEWLTLEDGTQVHPWDWLSTEQEYQMVFRKWKALRGQDRLVIPGLKQEPSEHQIKNFGEMCGCIQSIRRGFVLADGLGLGKTLCIIMLLDSMRKQPGLAVVVVPAGIIPQWEEALNGSYWQPGYGLKTLVFTKDNSKISPQDIIMQGYQVILVSYEMVMQSWKRKSNLPHDFLPRKDQLAEHNVTFPLHSDMWKLWMLPFKIVVCDESQKINNFKGSKFEAVENLYTRAFGLVSGSPMHNRWNDIYAFVRLMKGHPFTSYKKFLKTFGQGGPWITPEKDRLTRLQRFLQSVWIQSPQDVIQLPPLEKYLWNTPIHPNIVKVSNRYYTEYKEEVKKPRGDDDLSTSAFSLSIRAQQVAMHPYLLTGKAVLNEDEMGSKRLAEREEHLERLENWDASSPRIDSICELIAWCQAEYEGEKIVVYSTQLKFLDILEKRIEELLDDDIRIYRYDGTLNSKHRTAVERSWKKGKWNNLLLTTAGAGGVGLNFQEASIMIQSEVWWNWSNVLQAICRFYRRGQLNPVKYFQVTNDGIKMEEEMSLVSLRKSKTVNAATSKLVRHLNAPFFLIGPREIPRRRHRDYKTLIETMLAPDYEDKELGVRATVLGPGSEGNSGDMGSYQGDRIEFDEEGYASDSLPSQLGGGSDREWGEGSDDNWDPVTSSEAEPNETSEFSENDDTKKSRKRRRSKTAGGSVNSKKKKIDRKGKGWAD